MASDLGDGRSRPRRFGRLLAVVAGAVLLGALLRPTDTPQEGSVSTAPAFDLPGVDDPTERVRSADLRSRPAVVNFWASWCVPCRRELPMLGRVARDVTDVEFVGVNHLDTREDALDVLREMRLPYPSGHDPGGNTALAYGLRGMPSTVFIDSKGRVVKTHTGELSERQLRDALELLGEAR